MRIAFYAPLKPPDHPVAVGRPPGRAAVHGCAAPRRPRAVCRLAASQLRRRRRPAAPGPAARRSASALAERLLRRGGGRRRAARSCGSPTTSITRRRTGSARRSAARSAFPMSSPRPRTRRSAPAAPGRPATCGRRGDAPRRCGDRAQPGRPRRRLPLLRDAGRWVALPPFLDAATLSRRRRACAPVAAPVRLIAVAMMRDGDKLASYRLLAPRWRCCSTCLVAGGRRRRPGPRRGRGRAGAARPTRALPRRAGEARTRRRLCAAPTFSSGRRSTRRSAWRCSKRRRAALPVVAGASGGVADIVAGRDRAPGPARRCGGFCRGGAAADPGSRSARGNGERRRAPRSSASTTCRRRRRGSPRSSAGSAARGRHDRFGAVPCPAPARHRASAARACASPRRWRGRHRRDARFRRQPVARCAIPPPIRFVQLPPVRARDARFELARRRRRAARR